MKVLICGFSGEMGQHTYQAALKRNADVIGVDPFADPSKYSVPVFRSLSEVSEKADIIIDYSVKSALPDILNYALTTSTPAVLCTTGYTTEDFALIDAAASKIALFQTGNFSVGVNVMQQLVKLATKLLGDKADVEIIEHHHRRKVDAPSGTALMLANTVKESRPTVDFVYGREGMVGKRPLDEIAIHAVRGGTIVGKHEVVFALNNQVITLKHEAESRGVFAEGSMDAAVWLLTQPVGRYNMNDMMRQPTDCY